MENSNSSVDVDELAKLIKRPLSAYMIFSRDEREHLKNREPKLSFVEVTKFISQRWATVDQNVKENYYKMATMDKERFRQELAAAGLTGLKRAPKRVKKTKDKKRVVRHPGAPKKPLSSFLLFSQEKRADVRAELETGNITISVAVVGKRLGQMWNESSEEIKMKYKMLAEVEKKRYERAMHEFRQQFECGATNSSDDMYQHDHLGQHYAH